MIRNLPDEQFKVMTIKMLDQHRMDGNSEMFNRVRKYKEELNIPEEDKN